MFPHALLAQYILPTYRTYLLTKGYYQTTRLHDAQQQLQYNIELRRGHHSGSVSLGPSLPLFTDVMLEATQPLRMLVTDECTGT